MSGYLYISEEEVKKLLTWPELFQAIEMSLKSVCDPNEATPDDPTSSQPARTFTFGKDNSGVLLSMSGFIGNYKLPFVTGDRVLNTLACKLVTSFAGNLSLTPALPKIMATIMIMDSETGKMQVIVEGTEITKWRTAAASLVSTQALYFNRPGMISHNRDKVLTIVGCGVQGEIHAMAFAALFGQLKEIRLWNRSKGKMEKLHETLSALRPTFQYYEIVITKCEDLKECLKTSDIIITATSSGSPLVDFADLKNDVHINAIGAGDNHHSELSQSLYDNAQVYVDNWASARTELKDLKADIKGLVGDVLKGTKPAPNGGITVFQSMGMAVEDAAAAQLIIEKYKLKNVK